VQQSTEDRMIGRILPGGYVILDMVGIGGMGRVYRAEQTNLGRTVAVKIIHPHLVGEENAAARFITEARAASRLNHPNSVGVIDFGQTEDGQLYLVMEFLRGKDLARVMYEDGPLAFRRIVDLLRQVLAALSEAHHLQIIHRDLKPENVILEQVRSGGDFVKVVDFGLAKMRVDAMPNITSPGIVCGTPEYMSPEQGRGDQLDARSDLYAVGVIMYQLLTGRRPFEAESPTQVVLMHISEAPPDLHKVAPERGIPQALVDVCLMALAKDAKHRFSTADEFSAALEDALAQFELPPMRRPASSVLACPLCGAANPPTQKFCGECGGAMAPSSGRSMAPPPMALSPTEAPQASSLAAAMLGSLPPVAPQPASQPPRAASQPPVAQGETISQAAASQAPPAPAAAVASQPPAASLAQSQIPTRISEKPAAFVPGSLPLPFVGREEDLAWLLDRRKDASSVLVGARVVGAHGMGKSRLLTEFIARCEAEGDFVVSAGPDPGLAEVGYHAVRGAIRSLAAMPGKIDASYTFTGANSEALRGLGDIFGVADKSLPRATPEEQRSAIAESLRWAVARAAERMPGRKIVVAVDDLAQCDGPSQTAFADAVGEAPQAPALLVVTYAPGFDPGWPASTASARILAGLTLKEATDLLGPVAVPEDAANGTRGITPLYLEQVLRFAKEQGGEPPARLGDLVAKRVERLPQDARRVLQAIAVFGNEATQVAVKRMLKEKGDIDKPLSVLEKADMIGRDGERLRVSHPLLREVVLTSIPQEVRKVLHGVAAEVCEEDDAPIELRALHEYSAQNSFQALILLERVSTAAFGRGDVNAAIAWLRRGLELARRELFRGELDDPVRAVLIFSRKLGEALTQAGQFTDAEGVLREALDLAGPSGAERARVLGVLAQVSKGRDRKQEAQRYLREALELAFESGAHELLFALEDLKKTLAV
jgi:serine/threonine-protein kinase